MTDATRRPIRRALVSVYDKTDLVELARALVEAGVEIVSTGSTASGSSIARCAMTGPVSTPSSTKWTVTPNTFTP